MASKKQVIALTKEDKKNLNKVLWVIFRDLNSYVKDLDKLLNKFDIRADKSATLADIVELNKLGEKIDHLLWYNLTSFVHYDIDPTQINLKIIPREWMYRHYITEEEYLIYIERIRKEISDFQCFTRCIDRLDAPINNMIQKIFEKIGTREHWISRVFSKIEKTHDDDWKQDLNDCDCECETSE